MRAVKLVKRALTGALVVATTVAGAVVATGAPAQAMTVCGAVKMHSFGAYSWCPTSAGDYGISEHRVVITCFVEVGTGGYRTGGYSYTRYGPWTGIYARSLRICDSSAHPLIDRGHQVR